MTAHFSSEPTAADAARAARKLAGIFHPRWSSRDDHFLMTQRDKGTSFERIATGLMRGRVAVEQRWHRLRVVPNVLTLLEDYGLTKDPYPTGEGR